MPSISLQAGHGETDRLQIDEPVWRQWRYQQSYITTGEMTQTVMPLAFFLGLS
jgi:hypothetical protein